MKLYASGEDYLEMFLFFIKNGYGALRRCGPAHGGVKAQRVPCSGYLAGRRVSPMDEDHFLHLTEQGREVAEKIYERHCFFTEQLIAAGVDPKTAEADACRIEHVISDETFCRLKEKYQSENENGEP